jgi:hypothetical protein
MVAPAVFLLFVEVGYFSGLMRPEPLGFCLEILAVLVVLGRPSTGRVVLGALLFVLALYTKPNFIVGALAVAVLLLRRDRRQFVIFALTGLGAAVLVLVVGDELSGGFFSRNHVVAHISRVYAWSQFQQILFYGALPWAPILAGAILLAVRGIRRGEFDFPLVFFVISLALGLAMAPLEGSAAYYFYELYAATGLLLATRVEALSAAREGAMESALSFRRLIRGAIWLQLAVSLVGNVLVGTDRYATYRRVWKDAPALLDQLRPAPGWILVEDPILAVAAHRPVLAEIFMNSQLAQNGRWNQQPMLDLLESGGISRVVFRETPIETPNPVQLERFTPRMIAAVKKHFALSWSNESWFVYAYHPSGLSASPQPVPR